MLGEVARWFNHKLPQESFYKVFYQGEGNSRQSSRCVTYIHK